jgi:DNA-binding transcriptional MerR regulator
MGQNQPIRKSAHGHGARVSEIPDKLYFRIGEVARLCEVPAYVLRFWESEFPQLKPNKGGTGQRLYRKRDVEMALRVKTLLKEEGYTIPGARAVLKSEFRQKEPQPQLSLLGDSSIIPVPKAEAKQLRFLRRELESIAAMLSRPIGKPAGASKASAPAAKAPAVHAMRSPRRTESKSQPGEFAFDTPGSR